jgi:DNA polymerase IV (DinB-like DNA polymerase)
MKQVANELDFSEVKEWEEVKSISRSGTFKEDTNATVIIAGFLEMLAESFHRAPEGIVSFSKE